MTDTTANNDADSGSSTLYATFNQRDLILYALSLGFGSSEGNHDELKYLYEHHPDFTAVPTFCFALGFWAQKEARYATSYEIPPFPPVSISSTGTIPFTNLRGQPDISQYPVLHMNQSVQWTRSLPVPISQIRTRLEKRVRTVAPKSIGTFVTSETAIYLEDTTSRTHADGNSLLCTLQSTVLILGMPKENVIPLQDKGMASSNKVSIPKHTQPDFEWTYVTSPTQALLYRLASGDSNKIHVTGDPIMAKVLEGAADKPILHGLCTLGIATRAILLMSSTGTQPYVLSQLDCQFTKPVFLGDSLKVRIWRTSSTSSDWTLVFVVINETTRQVAVDKGYARLTTKEDRRNNSRLSKL
ncbi:MaoC like domain [Seminavis robusta]|uniref:MaoC like domain n=1 Tax=Seminavis robusta TaxID=568900 RepID=A0A9N8D9T0_9STRA|nr:MaoC like domain [Seminavis robusta]|eukprot:Sro49_g028570.1 MaoC like domain (356) ;mRNA; f:29736-30803